MTTAAAARRLVSPRFHTRLSAIWALADIHSVEAVPHLARALQDPDPGARVAATIALAHVNRFSALPSLRRAEAHDADERVRRAAAAAARALFPTRLRHSGVARIR